MPKQPASAPVAAAEPVESISIEEFCRRRSQSDRRVELLSAFHSEQTRTQQVQAPEAEFAARLDQFATQPV